MDSIGVIIGALTVGYLCGLLPYNVGKAKGREGWGITGAVLCLVAGFVGGLVFALPAALICTLLIALVPSGLAVS